MATTPAFASTPAVGSALVTTADTSLTAPAVAATIDTGGTNGTKIEEIICQGVGTTVAGLVNIFLHDGTTYHLVDQFIISAITVSTTVAAFRTSRTYANLMIPSSSWTLRASQSIAGNASLIKVTALGADF